MAQSTIPGAAYGRDTYCLDARQTGRLARGLVLLGQRCYHRLVTPRGMLRGGEDEANFGIDLSAEVGGMSDGSTALRLKGMTEAELRKEEIEEVEATVTETASGPYRSYSISIRVTAAEGPFELVLEVSAVTVELLKLSLPEAA